ncbi:MAG: NYN domain-containing protein [Pseudomonadota bacterium]
MVKTHVFIDGFNLYYGCLKGTDYKWLDVGRMCQNILKNASVEKIYYFTARVKPRDSDPTQNARQDTYLRALKTIPNTEVIFGHFLSHPVKMPRCSQKGILTGQSCRVMKTEEKGSDVNLASFLLRGAFQSEFEQAVLVTNDSDFGAPVNIVRQELGIKIGVLNPHPRRSRVLSDGADFMRPIRTGVLRVSQFPNELSDESGTFKKPAAW